MNLGKGERREIKVTAEPAGPSRTLLPPQVSRQLREGMKKTRVKTKRPLPASSPARGTHLESLQGRVESVVERKVREKSGGVRRNPVRKARSRKRERINTEEAFGKSNKKES